jgi:hypothetical protein
MKMKPQSTRTYGNTEKAVLKGKFITMNAYIKNTERSQINYLMLHHKQEQNKPKTSRKREIIKIRARINELETKKTIQRINKTKNCFFGKINKIDKFVENLTKMRRGKAQINKIRNEKGEITTNTKKIQGIMRDYFENLYPNKLENLEEMSRHR